MDVPPPDRYAESVDPAIHCSDCEAVCCRLTVLLMPEDAIPAWFTHRDTHGLEQMAKGEDGWCVALDRDSMRCSIYAQRPAMCRKFAMGGPYCRDERKNWYGSKPGLIPIAVLPPAA